jgi:hypothetical protein
MPTEPLVQHEYRVLMQGASSFRFLEGMGAALENLLNSHDVADYVAQGWELWQVNTLNDKQGNNGFLLVFRRPILSP